MEYFLTNASTVFIRTARSWLRV